MVGASSASRPELYTPQPVAAADATDASGAATRPPRRPPGGAEAAALVVRRGARLPRR